MFDVQLMGWGGWDGRVLWTCTHVRCYATDGEGLGGMTGGAVSTSKMIVYDILGMIMFLKYEPDKAGVGMFFSCQIVICKLLSMFSRYFKVMRNSLKTPFQFPNIHIAFTMAEIIEH